MLPETLIVGTLNPETYTKQFGDAQAGSSYSLYGSALSQAETLTVQSQLDKSKSRRTLIDLRVNKLLPDSVNGQFGTIRGYCNFVIPAWCEENDRIAIVDRMSTLFSDPAFLLQALEGAR
jgi:hypothetical protein